MARKRMGWIAALAGLILLVVGYMMTGGTLENSEEIAKAYMSNGGGWVALLGLCLMFFGFISVYRKHVKSTKTTHSQRV